MKIHDEVVILSGPYKGRIGVITRFINKDIEIEVKGKFIICLEKDLTTIENMMDDLNHDFIKTIKSNQAI